MSDLTGFPSHPEIVLGCVADHGIFCRGDRGDTWSRIMTGSFYDISISKEYVAFGTGDSEALVSYDMGKTRKSRLDAAAWRVATFRNGIVAAGAGIYGNYTYTCPVWRLSRDNGKTWETWAGTENTFSLLFQESGVVYRAASSAVYRSPPDD